MSATTPDLFDVTPASGPEGDEITFVYVRPFAPMRAKDAPSWEAARRAHRDGTPDAYEIGRRSVNSTLGAGWRISGELTADQFAAFQATGDLPPDAEWRPTRAASSQYAQPYEAAFAAKGGAR